MPKIKGPVQLADAASIAADWTSSVVDVSEFKRIGIEVSVVTADVNGTLSVQTSITGNKWETLDLDLAIAGSGVDEFYDVDVTAYTKLRLNFVHSSGATGTLTANYILKEKI